MKFVSGSFSIINDLENNGFILNFRCVNDRIKNRKGQTATATANRFVRLTKEFNIINENKIIVPFYLKQSLLKGNLFKHIYGMEDSRIFNYKNTIKIIGTTGNKNNMSCITTGDYDYGTNKLSNMRVVTPIFNKQQVEKNWSFFEQDEKLKIIYKWYPLQICEIIDNTLHLLEKKTMPIFFENARGSSCGIHYNDKIWFIVHFNESRSYYHFFAVFDLNMNLIKYSEKFKFENHQIEFCIGLVEYQDKFLIAYSTDDTVSKLGVYDIKNSLLQWKHIN